MSTAGQIAGGVVGTIIGSFFDYPMLGAQLGILLGGAIDPPKGPTKVGPRLSDLTVQTSTYGAFIPRISGTKKLAGNVFWLEGNKIKEVITKKKTGGKGGGKTTSKTPSYFATFAVGLADRTTAGITGVRRIWIKGDLFYDAGSDDPATIMASNEARSNFKVYPGSLSQEPDPRIQADVGVDNAPGYRGLAYIVFYDLPLANYANSLMGAQVEVEVVADGDIAEMPVWTSVGENTTLCSNLIFDGNKWTMLFASANKRVLWTEANDTWHYFDGSVWNGHHLNFHNGIYAAYVATGEIGSLVNEFAYSTDLRKWWSTPLPAHISDGCIVPGPAGEYLLTTGKYWAIATTVAEGFTYICGEAADGITIPPYNEYLEYQVGVFMPIEPRGAYNGHHFIFASFDKYRLGILSGLTDMTWSSVALAPGMTHVIDVIAVGETFYSLCVDASQVPYMTVSYDDGRSWSVLSAIPTNIDQIPYTGLAHNGSEFCLVEYVPDYFITSADGVTWNPRRSLISGAPVAVLRFPGVPVWGNSVWAVKDDHESVVTFGPTRIDSNYPTLGDIVAEECGYAGLSGGDIDVSSLTSEVRGYLVASQGSVRSALEPLRTAWPFDIVQRGYKLTFKARGGVSVATISANDLDAHNATGKPGVQITVNREMDSQLPRKLTIKYSDVEREYDVGEQYAERLNVSADNDISHDLPIVMTSTEAAGKAEVLLHLLWLERYDVAFTLPATYNQLEPADVVMLPTVEGTLRLRLETVNYTSDGRIECKARSDRQAVYTPSALGAPSKVTGPSTLPRVGASEMVLLDVPMMHTAQADPSFLAAMYGSSPGWQSGTVLRTDDAGSTWTELASFVTPGNVVGNATDTLGVVDSRVWDKASRLTVHVLNGDLYDTTEAGLMNGANHFAYGDSGRWEIIAAQKCTLGVNNHYVLSDLLRGRFGTEWAMGLHTVGDTVVLLDTNELAAIGMSVSAIGVEKSYRAITLGQAIETGKDARFTYVGVNLECLSPINLTGNRAPSGDWTFNWTRRSRTDWEWRDNVDVSLGETTEAYEVDFFTDSTYTTVKRTVTASTTTCGYTNAQQVTDFGAVQGDIFWKTYQMSAVVGRGYPATGFSTTRHYLVADNCTQSNVSPFAFMAAVFNAAPSVQHATSLAVAITQTQILVGTSASQASACNTGAIFITHNVIVTNCTEVNNCATGVITQIHKLTVANSSQGNLSPGCILGSSNADPYWSYVKLLLLMDTTTANDKKYHTVTTHNSAPLETTDAPFSGGHILNLTSNATTSWYYDSGIKYLSIPGSADFVLGSDPFCIEFFLKTTEGSGYSLLDFYSSSSGEVGWSVGISGSNLYMTKGPGDAPEYVVQTDDTTCDGTLRHIAIASDGSVCQIWIDGSEASSYIDQLTYDPINFEASTLYVGAGVYDYAAVAKIGPVRITVGHQRYTASFTPPMDYPYS